MGFDTGEESAVSLSHLVAFKVFMLVEPEHRIFIAARCLSRSSSSPSPPRLFEGLRSLRDEPPSLSKNLGEND